MGKDYTDYLCIILGEGERVHTVKHIRQIRGDFELKIFNFNGHSYLFDRNRAYRKRGKIPYHIWDWSNVRRSVRDVLRGKKIGVLLYQEPGRPRAVTQDIPVFWECLVEGCDFATESERGFKIHASTKHKGIPHETIAQVSTEERTAYIETPEPIEPIHTSRLHQPSGRNKELYPHAKIKRDLSEPPSLLETVTPRTLKADLDAPQFKRAYNSFKFGAITPIANRWWIWLAIAFVAVFIILYATGNFDVGGG